MRALNLTLFAMMLVLMLVMANVYDYHAIERLYLPGWAAFLCVGGNAATASAWLWRK